jgi:D-aminopeptidase
MSESSQVDLEDKRYRARELGIEIGVFPVGNFNAITDVKGVKVGHTTIVKGSSTRTGVTAVLPHGNIFQEKVPGAMHCGNGFGKLVGYTQVKEFGTIETPIVLTNTLSVFTAADALVEYTLSFPGNENVKSANPIVGETSDEYLNDIRNKGITKEDVFRAIKNARSGFVEEGSVGAGTGTTCLGWKGGIGTASRVLPGDFGGYRVGVLVQSNFGGILSINGAPVGRELDNFYFRKKKREDGSCMIIVATDAPLSSRDLERLAKRALLGLARTGGFSSNRSGDYIIAFSTVTKIEHEPPNRSRKEEVLYSRYTSPLFCGVAEATEEAIINSILKATTVTGYKGHVGKAIPIDQVIEMCRKYNVLNWNKSLPMAG